MDKQCELLRIKDLLPMLGISRTRLYSWIEHGHFPRPFHVAPKVPRWRRSTVEAWLASREAA